MSEKQNLLDVQELSLGYRYGRKVETVVKSVSFSLREGEVLGLIGESGCGKSTLSNGLLGYTIPPLAITSGSIFIDGVNIAHLPDSQVRSLYLGKKIALIPQTAIQALNPTLTIRTLAEDLMAEHKPHLDSYAVEDLLEERLSVLGLGEEIMDMYPVELSGGIRQRVVIALSTLANPNIIIADEPTSALDVSTQRVVLKMLKSLMAKGFFKSMIFVTHELPLLYHIADTVAVMTNGQIVECGPTEEVIHSPKHEYTKLLMDEAHLLSIENGGRHE